MIAELISENEQGVKLFEMMNEHRVIDSLLFEPHQKILFPIVLLHILKKKKEAKQRALQTNQGVLGGKKIAAKRLITPKMAYKMLKTQRPRSELTGMVSKFLLDNLPENFLLICESESEHQADPKEFEEFTYSGQEEENQEKGKKSSRNKQDYNSPGIFESSIRGSAGDNKNGLSTLSHDGSKKKDPRRQKKPTGKPRRMTLPSQQKKRFLNFERSRYQKAAAKGKHNEFNFD